MIVSRHRTKIRASCALGGRRGNDPNSKAFSRTIWKPELENAIAALGKDAMLLQDKSGYRELFNLEHLQKGSSGSCQAPCPRRIAKVAGQILRTAPPQPQRVLALHFHETKPPAGTPVLARITLRGLPGGRLAGRHGRGRTVGSQRAPPNAARTRSTGHIDQRFSSQGSARFPLGVPTRLVRHCNQLAMLTKLGPWSRCSKSILCLVP